MANQKRLTPEEHKKQINVYTAEFPRYQACAEILKRLLEIACRASFPDWATFPNLYPLPLDPGRARAFVTPADHPFDPKVQEEMAKSFHHRYVAGSANRLPSNMRPREKPDETFKTANLEQAEYSVEILEAAGFEVRQVDGPPVVFSDFTDEEVERMAEIEHGRWNVECLRDGRRYGKVRDDSRKIHNYLVSWEGLDEGIKHYDRDAVRTFPAILAKVELEVRRR